MNWGNLKKYKCPICIHDLFQNYDMREHQCTCGFRIGYAKFESFVSNKKAKVYISHSDEESNLLELNNL